MPVPSPQEREATLFALAFEKSLAERAAFLQSVCGNDQSLRLRLEALLAAHDHPHDALEANMVPPLEQNTIKLAPAELPDEAAGQKLGRYKLLEKIGEGGCGVVYVAEQTEPVRRRVALKVIKLGMDTKSVVARFEMERQALAMMDHSNIAKVFDAGCTASGRPYFVMELVRGIRITDYCDQNHLTTKERLELFIKVCQAIQHAHQKGVIHRDIKPSNILVTLHDGVPIPKVIDFGIAKATEGRLTDATVYTELHQFMGTPAYMSPEQAEMSGLDIDTRSDIYSLGVLLYELLAGNPPFDPAELLASGLDAMRRAIREREPVRPSTRFSTLKGEELTATAKRRSVESAKLLHQIKGDLDWIVMKCLEKDRTRRYETATGLALDLKRHLDSEPVLARPPTAAYKLQKAIRRNKTLFAAAALVVLALAAGLGLAAVGWQQTKLERDRALQAQAREAVERRRAQASEQAAKSAEAGQAGLRLQAEAQALTARRRAYAADMNLAQQALAINNIGRAKVLLDQQRPEPGQTDLRGWEWRFLWNQIRPDDHEILFAGTNRINHPLSFSADGQLLVREFAGEAVVTDVKSHQIVWQQTNAWWPVFTHHGLTLAYASRVSATNSSITLEDLGTHKQDRLSMPWATTEWIGFTADDRRMILVSDQGNCLVTAYDFDRKSSVWSRLISFPTYNWRPYAISPDGQSFAGVTPGGGVVVMDMQNGNVRFAIKAADDNSTAVAFSPDSSILLTGGGFTESMIRLWDAHGGKRLDSLEGHHSYICDLLFTADGKTLISSSGDETIRLWDWTRRKPAGILRGHHDEVDGLALAADGQTLASRCKDGSVYLWDLGKPSIHLGYSMLPNRMTLENTIFTPDSRFILGLEEAGGLAEWDVTSGQETRRWWPSTTNHSFVALSRDGKQIACLESDGRLHVLDVSSDSEVTNMSLPAGVSPLMFTANGHYFVNLLENASRRELEPWKTDNWEKANPIAIARDGDPNYGETSLPDSVFVITGHAFHIFDVAQPTQPPKIIGNEGALCGYASSPDGQTTACCYEQGQIRLWNMATLKPIDTLKGFLLGAHSVTFSPDGRRLAAGSNGQEAVKLWDAQTRQEVLTLGGEGSMFMSLQFSPDGRHLMGINAARHAHIWYAPSWEEIAAAEAVERPGNGP